MQKLLLPVLTACTLLAGASRIQAQALVQIDSTKTWAGFMSWSPMPGDAPGFGGSGNGSWGAADLRAVFVSDTLEIRPNTNVYNPAIPYWVNADGSGANKMDASFFVQNDSLITNNVTFTGSCVANDLDPAYTCNAFIKVFDSGFNVLGMVVSGVVAGQSFSITQPAVPGAVHVQYGFETVGPDANPATADALGHVVMAVPVGLNVIVDPNQFWAGYMNWSPVDPFSGYGGTGNQPWGAADLRAYFTTNNPPSLFLLPNTNTFDPANPQWVNPNDNSGANNMDANFYVTDDTIVNTNVIFSGYCISNTLAPGYTAQAFIKIFTAGYGYLGGAYSGNLVPGQSFILNLDTTGAGHVQYGFVTDGADANPATADALGLAMIAAAAPVIPPPVLQIPTNNAPTPTQPSGNVTSMYNSSGVYTDSPYIAWYASWGATTSQGDYTNTVTGRVVKKYAGLQYAGIEFYTTNAINASAYDTIHLDLWTPNANQFGIKLVSFTGGTQDPQVNITVASGLITTNHWLSLDIPFTEFLAIQPAWDPANLQQMLFVDNSTVGAGAQLGTFYVDNVYFYNSTVVNPTLNAVISGGGLDLSFPTQNGTSYTIQYKTNLLDAAWLTLTNFVGDGSTPVVTDPADKGSRFYRLSIP